MIKVLVVDDSITVRQALSQIINATHDMQVVGMAINGTDAIQQVQTMTPDIILMDLFMPNMDGLEATEEIMAIQPTPIIIISGSLSNSETQASFQAMRLGALAVMTKPVSPLDEDYDSQISVFLNTLRALANVKVIHHRKTLRAKPDLTPTSPSKLNLPSTQPKLIAIAISTGGPGTMADILKQLPADFPIPIVIIQHITEEFVHSLVKWLNGLTPLHVKIAEVGEIPQAGCVYYSPGNAHLCLNGVKRFEIDLTMRASYTPSANILFESIAKHYGDTAVGVVLTGMGDDGAQGLRKMYDCGSYTIAQDENSSIVYGMPREAVAIGAVRRVASASEIPEIFIELAKRK